MTLFQAIVTAVIGVFSEIFPVGAGAYQSLLEFFFGWNVSSPQLTGAIDLGFCLGLAFTLRHDLLSHLSSFLQVIVYRKKPRAMDERMPFFILIALFFPVAAFFFARQSPILPSEDPYLFAAIFSLSGIPLAFFDYYTKKNKSIYDWNALDAAFIGLGSAALAVPEIGRTAGAFTFSALRGYSREGAGKFILYVTAPLAALSAWYHLKGPGATLAISEFPKIYFYATLVVATLSTVFAAHVYLSQLKSVTLTRYAIYRALIALAVIGTHFYRNSG